MPQSVREVAVAKKKSPASKKKSAPKGLATLETVEATLRHHYPEGLGPDRVAYFLSEPWLRNLEARKKAEDGSRFLEDLCQRVKDATRLDATGKADLVARPAWLVRVLLHKGKRLKGAFTDDVLRDLGGEARLLDVWISALGPYYYARGYRIRPSLQEELEGPPPPLDRDDPHATAAMEVVARELRSMGFARVPGEVAKSRLARLRSPVTGDPDPSCFELLFGGAGAGPAPASGETTVRTPNRASTSASSRSPDSEADPDVALEMELFKKELEDELEDIRREIDRAREEEP